MIRVGELIGFTCEVCGYLWKKKMRRDGEICPCCGTEYGVDDYVESGTLADREAVYEKLRREWVRNGMEWFSGINNAPEDWNPKHQLYEKLTEYRFIHDTGERFVKWLNDNVYWEDPDQQIMIISTEKGGIGASDFEGGKWWEGSNLEELRLKMEEDYWEYYVNAYIERVTIYEREEEKTG